MEKITCTDELSKSPDNSLGLDKEFYHSTFIEVSNEKNNTISKLDSDDLLCIDTLCMDPSLDQPSLGGFYDLADMDKFSSLKSDDVQMHEISSTDTVKCSLDSSLLIDTDLVMDTVSPKIILPNKPRIISFEILEQKILLCPDTPNEYNNNTNLDDFDKTRDPVQSTEDIDKDIDQSEEDLNETEKVNKSLSDSLLDAEDFLGFPKDEVEPSFEKLSRSVPKELVTYNFQPVYRESPTISIPKTESNSYLRFNLPDQEEPLEMIGYRRNLIRSSKFHSGSGYTVLDSMIKNFSINCDSNNKRKTKKNKRRSSENRKTVIQKGKLNMLIKKRINDSVDTEEKSSVERIQTRSLLKTLNQPIQMDDTPKSHQPKQSARKLIISEFNKNHIKDVRICLKRIEIVKEYAHLDYLNSCPFIDPSPTSENEQSLSMAESLKKKISVGTRRSDRLRNNGLKGIIVLKSKSPIKINKTVTFSSCVLINEY